MTWTSGKKLDFEANEDRLKRVSRSFHALVHCAKAKGNAHLKQHHGMKSPVQALNTCVYMRVIQ